MSVSTQSQSNNHFMNEHHNHTHTSSNDLYVQYKCASCDSVRLYSGCCSNPVPVVIEPITFLTNHDKQILNAQIDECPSPLYFKKKEPEQTIPNNVNDVVQDYMDNIKNKCMICSIDMGTMNPRQLCGKTYCMDVMDHLDV